MIALYSVENQYEQPACNLVALFENKPSLELLAKALGQSFPCPNDSDTLTIINIWSNPRVSYMLGTQAINLRR